MFEREKDRENLKERERERKIKGIERVFVKERHRDEQR